MRYVVKHVRGGVFVLLLLVLIEQTFRAMHLTLSRCTAAMYQHIMFVPKIMVHDFRVE